MQIDCWRRKGTRNTLFLVEERHMKIDCGNQNLQGLFIQQRIVAPPERIFCKTICRYDKTICRSDIGQATELQLRLVKYLPVMNDHRC